MSEQIPDGWEVSTLSELANYINGRAFKPADWSKSGLPILRIAQINDPSSTEDFYDGKDVDEKHLVRRGDLIFSWSATLKAEIWKHYDAVLNQHIFKVDEKESTDKIYLQQLLEHSIPKLSASSHGSTMKHIKKGVLDEFQVSVPPLPEQKKIAAILTSVDEVIENTQKQINKLQDLKKATMNELLTKGIGHTEFKGSELGRIPKNWKVSALSELAHYINGRAFKPADWSKSGLPILRIAQINDPSSVKDFYAGKDVDEKHLIRRGDLIFSWSATLKAEIWKHYDAVLNQHIFKVKEKENADKIYLQQILEHSIPKLSESSHGSTMKHIKKGVLDEFLISVPSLSEQKKIASILTSMDKTIEERQRKLQQTQSLKKSLMQDLLTGKVRTTGTQGI